VTGLGQQTLSAGGGAHDATVTIDNMIVEGSGSHGMRSATGAEYLIPDGSTLLLLNNGDHGMYLTDTENIDSNGVMFACGNGKNGFRADANVTGTIDELIGQNNSWGLSAPSNVTITTETAGACQTDIASVPTAAEVGIGTQ
jgi:hypothetical protein